MLRFECSCLYGNFTWQAALVPTARSGMTRITVGVWRDDKSGPMQLVSGAIGKNAFAMKHRGASW